jgi:hypothetical protein
VKQMVGCGSVYSHRIYHCTVVPWLVYAPT